MQTRKRPLAFRSALVLALSALGISACASSDDTFEYEEETTTLNQALNPGTVVKVTFSSEYNPANSGWYTNNWEPNVTYKLDNQADLFTANPNGAAITAINVYPGTQYQYIDGIGGSMEASTVYNLMRMDATTRTNLLKELFTHDGWGNGKGINQTLTRICLGTSDFTNLPFYSYGSPASIQEDVNRGIIGVLQTAKGLSPFLRFMGSPWTPPESLKTQWTLMGTANGQDVYLASGQINAHATYLRQAVKAYSDNGLKLWGMTMQNEPLFPAPYPGMKMYDWQARDVAKALRTELNNNGQNDVKILQFDHNFAEVYPFIDSLANDSAAVAAIDGTAMHDYSGDPSMMTNVHNDGRLAGKSVHMSERSWWGVWGADRIAQYFRNWSQSYNAWVTMLDSNKTPEQWSGTPDPTMLIQSASAPNTYWRTPEYYIMGQFSKYVVPGARRINSDAGSAGTVTNVAFLNPSGEVVTVVINQTTVAQQFKILSQGQQITATLPAKTVGTYRWMSDAWTGGPGVGAQIQAENMYQSGGKVSGTTVGYFENGDYMSIRDVNFNGATSLNMQVAVGGTGGTIEVRLNSPTGTLLGSTNVTSTGGWSTYANRNVPFTTTYSGVGALVVRAVSSGGGVMNSDYFTLQGGGGGAPPPGTNVTIQAESGVQSGTQLENGNTTVGFFDAGDYMQFNNVNMQGVTSLDLRIAGLNSGGVAEVRLDSPTGTLLASYTMVSTGGWATWATRNVPLAASSGTHTLYIRGASGGGIFNTDYFVTR